MTIMWRCGTTIGVVVAIGCACACRTGEQPARPVTSNGLRQTMPKPRMAFEQNEGQTDQEVRFLSRGPGFQVFLTDSDAVFALSQPSIDRTDSTPFSARRGASWGMTTTATVRMTLVNSRREFRPIGRRPQRGRVNYFLGRDRGRWLTGVPLYGEVVYRGVYRGIDLVYHDGAGDLEYDFIVSPGADVRPIRITFAGIERLESDGDGELVLHAHDGQLRLRKPVAYQEVDGARLPVRLRYVIDESGEVSFDADAYDHQRPLVIDPVLTYSTYLGGVDLDFGRGIAVDSSNRAVVSGWTSSRDFPTANALQPELWGGADAFVTKFSEDGSEILFSTYLGGSGLEDSRAIAVDSSDNIYVIGRTDSDDFPTVNPFQSSFGGGIYDAYLVKLSADGSQLLSASYLGGSRDDAAGGIAIDADGHAFVVGDTGSPDFPTVNAYQAQLRGRHDAFVAKVEADGSALAYSTYLGGSDFENGFGIAVDADGAAYVTGNTFSADFPTVHAFQPSYADNSDAFISKLSPSGADLVYSTYLGGTDNDAGIGIMVQESGQATVMGRTSSADFPTHDALQPVPGGGLDLFVAKLTQDGAALVYSTYLGGQGSDIGQSLTADIDGNIYMTGETRSSDFPVRDAIQPTYAGQGDAFVTKIASSGAELMYSTYVGGTGPDSGIAITVDHVGSAHVAGQTQSFDFPIANAFQPRLAGGSDAFLIKISAAPGKARGQR